MLPTIMLSKSLFGTNDMLVCGILLLYLKPLSHGTLVCLAESLTSVSTSNCSLPTCGFLHVGGVHSEEERTVIRTTWLAWKAGASQTKGELIQPHAELYLTGHGIQAIPAESCASEKDLGVIAHKQPNISFKGNSVAKRATVTLGCVNRAVSRRGELIVPLHVARRRPIVENYV